MKNKFIILIIAFCIFFCFVNSSFSGEIVATSKKTGYPLYQEQIKEFCKKYKDPEDSSESVELLYILDESTYFVDLLEKSEPSYIDEAISKYRKNMDDLYNCVTSISTKRQILLIKEELIKKSPELKTRFEPKLDEMLEKVEAKVEGLEGECKIGTDKKDNQIKKDVLNQVTYEFCKYNFYLEYMDWQLENYPEKYPNESVGNISRRVLEGKKKIRDEIYNSSKTTPLTFTAYSEYEDNIGNHLLLLLIKEDFSIIRDGLQKTLNPINQVVYKVSNAMKY